MNAPCAPWSREKIQINLGLTLALCFINTATWATDDDEHVHDHVNVHVNVHELPPDLMSDVDVVVDVHVVVLGSFICGSAAPRRSAKSV